MDRLKEYQNIIADYITEYAKIKPANLPDIDSYAVVDRVNNHFQLLQLGWQGEDYIFTVVLHFDIKDGKVWFQRNITDRDVVDELMAMGIAKQDIVLGFRYPKFRAYTGFAVA